MSYDVKWSEDSLADYQSILEYLNEHWGKSSVIKFQKIVDKEIEIISTMPRMYSFINKLKKLRRCVLVKQVSLYYLELEVEKEVFVVRLLDNRQDPQTIQEELEKFN
jgi:plasmid stabilization system protein ParE